MYCRGQGEPGRQTTVHGLTGQQRLQQAYSSRRQQQRQTDRKARSATVATHRCRK